MRVIHKDTGDQGTFDGAMVRRDQGAPVPFDAAFWRPVHTLGSRREAAARVAFHADLYLCALIGLHEKARQTWDNLSIERKAQWINVGPEAPVIRREMYALIMEKLKVFYDDRDPTKTSIDP